MVSVYGFQGAGAAISVVYRPARAAELQGTQELIVGSAAQSAPDFPIVDWPLTTALGEFFVPGRPPVFSDQAAKPARIATPRMMTA
jgi:hypothetical protein